MTTALGPRKTVSVHDYPEHLNPFHEDDNHNKIRFWTIGRKLNRANSISFSGIKDLKNSWSLRSFMKKGKKREPPIPQPHQPKENQPGHSNGGRSSQLPGRQVDGDGDGDGDDSPVVFRRAMQYSSMSRSTAPVGGGAVVGADRYVYGGSITPLPRSRFQERLRSSQQEINNSNETPRMARSDIMGSRLSMESTNPFDEESPVPPVRASRRKKKRAAPLPPLAAIDTQEIHAANTTNSSELRITEAEDKVSPKNSADDEMDELNLKIELKITEDEDVKTEKDTTEVKIDTSMHPKHETASGELGPISQSVLAPCDGSKELHNDKEQDNDTIINNITEAGKYTQSKDDTFNKESFPKVDIVKYRRNSSVNEDDIRLRRGNLEDFHSLSNKRSKSLTNTFDGVYVAYDINLNVDSNVDINSNEGPRKVTCKLYDNIRKKSIDTISSTEKEFMEIDIATRELEREISKLNSALIEDDIVIEDRPSVSDIKKKFDTNEVTSPNPIPKPRRSHYGDSPVNGNVQT